MLASLVGLLILLGLLALGLPIGFAMAAVGLVGFGLYVGVDPALKMMGQIIYEASFSYELAVLPLFIVMANFVVRAGLADEMYAAANAFLGRLRGGLAIATVVACGGFSAVCGSSLATVATMAKVALPSMRRRQYPLDLAAGSVAAGGTLGILIPPSVILVLYGIMTENSIGKLFAAGVVPGLLQVSLFCLVVALVVRLRRSKVPAPPQLSWGEKLGALRGVWGVLALIVAVMGGLYGGVFTATEAAGIGAVGAFALALLKRTLSLRGIFEVLMDSATTTAMMFVVLFGALIFANFVNIAGLPDALTSGVRSLGAHPLVVISVMLAFYLLLGCVMDTIGMVTLTVPTFYPVILALGIDPIWFGIFVVMVTEIGMITPPVGMNVFMLRAVYPDIKTGTIYRGVVPFWLASILLVAAIIALPGLALFLPSLMP